MEDTTATAEKTANSWKASQAPSAGASSVHGASSESPDSQSQCSSSQVAAATVKGPKSPSIHCVRDLMAVLVLGETALILLLVALALWNPERSLKAWAMAVNRANAEEENERELLAALSHHAYIAELVQEYLTSGWTTKQALGPVLVDYNNSIARVRSLEGQAMASGALDADMREAVEHATSTVKSIDAQLRKLTGELVAVNVQETKDHADPEKATATAQQLLPLVKQLQSQISNLPSKS